MGVPTRMTVMLVCAVSDQERRGKAFFAFFFWISFFFVRWLVALLHDPDPFQSLQSTTNNAMSSFGKLVSVFFQEYAKQPSKIKLIDFYLSYILITGVIQFAYCLLVGTFPFNSFLAGFISTVGCFVMTGSVLLLEDHQFHACAFSNARYNRTK
jgi:hypothetical protein